MLNLLIETSQIWTYVILGVLVVAIIVMFIFSSRRRKKQEQDAQNLINAVKPGNKVKTIGGICGIVVEVDEEENTFVLETGSEISGKCYIKFDRQAIYQTDAVVDKAAEAADVKPAEENNAEPFEEKAEVAAEAPSEEKAEEAPAEEQSEAAKPEEGKKKSKAKTEENS